MTTTIQWIDVKTDLPKLSGDYLVVWNLRDGDVPVSAYMFYDTTNVHKLGNGWVDAYMQPAMKIPDEDILFWAELPAPPPYKQSRPPTSRYMAKCPSCEQKDMVIVEKNLGKGTAKRTGNSYRRIRYHCNRCDISFTEFAEGSYDEAQAQEALEDVKKKFNSEEQARK